MGTLGRAAYAVGFWIRGRIEGRAGEESIIVLISRLLLIQGRAGEESKPIKGRAGEESKPIKGLLSVDFEDDTNSSSDILSFGWTINTKYYTADITMWMAHLFNQFSITEVPMFDHLAALVMVFDLNNVDSWCWSGVDAFQLDGLQHLLLKSIEHDQVDHLESYTSDYTVQVLVGYCTVYILIWWSLKMNGTKDSIKQLVSDLNSATLEPDVDAVVGPPFIYIDQVKSSLTDRIEIAAQNSWIGKGGEFTGKISAEQLKDIGCKWVILGHSERRHVIGEDDQFIGKKAAYALGQNFGVIACIGELLEEREAGKTFDVCFKQLKAYADAVSSWDNIVIAYEPVWAIGTGKVASP